MSRNFVRGLQTTTRMLMQFVGGVTADDILVSNGVTGAAWEQSARRVTDTIEKADPRITVARIEGARAHYSPKDKKDHEMVVTRGLATAAGMQVGSVQVHVNSTFQFFPSLAGRKVDVMEIFHVLKLRVISITRKAILPTREATPANAARTESQQMVQYN
ncbi:hypothetical protein ABOM_007278 [Aspergillus bombycis]|uniref:Uncharacterized protein n=1 Tax=Aspergillus bombycis TaxID=109264 RepID=A0A1F7ZXA1_9EURO|nr:hypothetical protein ABOM_007278 [Aspergillus bombycis]OGM44086.1 hypothetical protein ABOM_007278 [Aspergillus bombycis]